MALKLTDGAMAVLEARYLERDASGVLAEDAAGMFGRVAANIAEAEAAYDPDRVAGCRASFLRMMSSLEFLPNSPTLMNAGRALQQLAACFVLPIEDSLSSIFEAVKQTALIHQSGGGTGFSFSSIRPAGDMVGSTGGVASGPVSFIRVFNAATEAIKQGGCRRGANMGVLRVDHPDIDAFVTAKDAAGELRNFNLSVAVTDAFMEAVEKGGDYALVNPRSGEETARRPARELFDVIVQSALKSGEPGVLFIDRINAANPTPHIGGFEAVNPCGEQPLLAFEPCNLGSINLARMLVKKGGGRAVDFDKLGERVIAGVRFLDDVIDACRYPTAEIDAMAKGNRKIGLGVMGLADMLARMRLPYDSDEAVDEAERVMKFINETARYESARLAEEKGPFPNIKGSVFDKPGVRPPRNATVTTVAPTGSLSIIAGCSSGIEPFYSLSYTRNILGGVMVNEVNPLVEEISGEDGFYSEGLIDFVSKGGDIRQRKDVPEEAKSIFRTAFDISPEAHIRMQAAFQRHTDNAVSKTINLPAAASADDVAAAFTLAYKLGCKGVTVYRSGSREAQALTCAGQL